MLQGVLLVASFLFFFQGLSFLARLLWTESTLCNSAGPFGVVLPPYVLGGTVLGILGALLVVWWKKRGEPYAFVWLILIAGGASNALERLQYGCVFDYIAFPWWPVFNIADVALFISVVFLVWREYTRAE